MDNDRWSNEKNWKMVIIRWMDNVINGTPVPKVHALSADGR